MPLCLLSYVYWLWAAVAPIWCIDYTSSEISEYERGILLKALVQHNCVISRRQTQNTKIFNSVFLFSLPSPCFSISGRRCYDTGEQCSCSPRQESDGQRRRRPSEIPTHQHHGTVLGKTHRKLKQRGSSHAEVGGIPPSRLSLSFSYFDYSVAVFTVGTPGLVNHSCYYGRLSRVLPILFSAPETSEGIWNLWRFFFFFFFLNGDQKAVICRQKCNYQLNGNRNFICGSTAGLFLLSVLLFSLRWLYFTFYLYASFHPELILRLHLTLFFSSLAHRLQKPSCPGCWSCSTDMSCA